MVRQVISAGFLIMALADQAHAMGSGDLAACKAMRATFAPRQAEIAGLTEQREASALRVDDAGTGWEDAETHRLVSAAHAASADLELAAFEAARKQLAREELALQSAVTQFNADVSAYNIRCAADR